MFILKKYKVAWWLAGLGNVMGSAEDSLDKENKVTDGRNNSTIPFHSR
jgi:hypothetical protein